MANRYRKKVFTVTDPIFKTEPLFILGCSFASFAQVMKQRFQLDVGENVGQSGQMFTFKETPWRVVWTKTLDPACVFHEVFHLVTRICEDKGIPIKAHFDNGELGDEAAAYLFEFFGRSILPRLGVRHG